MYNFVDFFDVDDDDDGDSRAQPKGGREGASPPAKVGKSVGKYMLCSWMEFLSQKVLFFLRVPIENKCIKQ